ncbi:hypothetical protein [Streptomyces sp. NPDC003480]
MIQQLTSAFLRSAFYPEDTGWQAAATALEEDSNPLRTLQSK